jgi:hypothetical protein
VSPRFLPACRAGRRTAAPASDPCPALALDHLLDEPDLVVGVEDREAGLQADQLGMPAQDLDADGVEGAEPGHALTAPPTSADASFISRAALLVKVTARICEPRARRCT